MDTILGDLKLWEVTPLVDSQGMPATLNYGSLYLNGTFLLDNKGIMFQDSSSAFCFPECYVTAVVSTEIFRTIHLAIHEKVLSISFGEATNIEMSQQLDRLAFCLHDDREAIAIEADHKETPVKTRRKKESRRASISFEGLEEFRLEESESLGVVDTGIVTEKNDADARTLVRQYVAALGSSASKELGEALEQKLSYDIGIVDNNISIPRSPPHLKKPTKAELKILKPIIQNMFSSAAEQKSKIELSLGIRVESPKSSNRKSYRYIDVETSKEIPAKLYAQKYSEYIRPKQGTFKDADVENMNTGNLEKAIVFEKEPILEKETVFEPTLEKELMEAEKTMHKEFDAALDRFMMKKQEIEAKYKAKSKRSRRKSICLDDMVACLDLGV